MDSCFDSLHFVNVFMYIVGAKYCPNGTVQRVCWEQRAREWAGVVTVYNPAIFFPEKTLHILRLRGSWLGNKSALSCLAVQTDAFSTFQLNARVWQALPGASWTSLWIRTCLLRCDCPGRWHSWNGCMIVTNIHLTLTVYRWPYPAVKPWSDTLGVLVGSQKNFCSSSVVFKRKLSPCALFPMNPAAEREELVTMAKETTSVSSLKL